MGGAPVIEEIRPGVAFAPDAARAFRRAEASWGSTITCSSTYRDYEEQLGMYWAWKAWIEGWGPKPNHSRAVHPDESKHCQGLAVDTPMWSVPGFLAHMARHGFIQILPNDPTERHHLEYQWSRDQYRNDPVPDSAVPIEEQSEEDDMPKNSGHTYPVPTGARPERQTWYAIFFNTGSGWRCEQSMPQGQKFDGGELSKIAKTYDTTDMTETSEEYVKLLKASLDQILPRR